MFYEGMLGISTTTFNVYKYKNAKRKKKNAKRKKKS